MEYYDERRAGNDVECSLALAWQIEHGSLAVDNLVLLVLVPRVGGK